MRLDVVVPCYGQHKLTHRLLASFAAYAPEWARLVLVDNARGLPQIPRPPSGRLPRARIEIRNSENLGFVRAVNQGICASDAEYLCIQNNDTEIFRGCYEQLLSDLLAYDLAAISPVASEGGSAWLSIDQMQKMWDWYAVDLPERHIDRARYLREAGWDPGVYAAGMIPFFCTLMPRTTIDRVGLLDPRFGLGLGDDDDYCKRIRDADLKAGFSLSTYVYHKGRATFDANFTPAQIEAMAARNKAAFNAKHGTDWV